MEGTELRIGNLVLFSEDNTIFTVQEIDNVGIGVINEKEQTWIELEYFEPIPLTEEILQECGLTKPFKNGHTWLKDMMSIVFYNGIIENVGGVQIQIKYLHQLQNLYWCLCGKELEVNL